MANMNQEYQLRRCAYVNRGCTTRLKHETSLSHLRECGFAPVQCSHIECEVTVNRHDLNSHERNCQFRIVFCEECREMMEQRVYEKHNCVLRRELAEMRRILQGMQSNQVSKRTVSFKNSCTIYRHGDEQLF